MADRHSPQGRVFSATELGAYLGGRLVSLLMILAVVWAVCSTVRFVISFSRPASPSREVAEATLLETLGPIPSALTAHGTWTIGEVPWYLSTESVRGEDLPERMRRPPATNALDTADCGACLLPDAWQKFLARYRLPSMATDTFTTYDVPLANMHLRVFSRRAEHREMCLGGYGAWHAQGGQWTLITIRPRCAASLAFESQTVLGYPTEVTRVAARWSREGDLQCEVVLPQAPLPQFLAAYRSSGWRVEQPAWARNIPYYVCVKEDRQVHLRLIESPPELGQVMIVAIPIPARTSCRHNATPSLQEART